MGTPEQAGAGGIGEANGHMLSLMRGCVNRRPGGARNIPALLWIGELRGVTFEGPLLWTSNQ